MKIDKSDLYSTKETVQKVSKKIKKKLRAKNKKTKETLIKRVEVTIKKETRVKNTNRVYERRVDQWFVKGHWRNYKNGKKIWIEPCIKKAKAVDYVNEPVKKIYKVV